MVCWGLLATAPFPGGPPCPLPLPGLSRRPGPGTGAAGRAGAPGAGRRGRGDAAALAELEDRFFEPLAFGTGGLRGIMAAGLRRMNKPNVRRTTLALAEVARAARPPGASDRPGGLRHPAASRTRSPWRPPGSWPERATRSTWATAPCPPPSSATPCASWAPPAASSSRLPTTPRNTTATRPTTTWAAR